MSAIFDNTTPVIKSFSKITDAQRLTDTSQVFDLQVLLMNFVTLSVSEFYFVSVPDILYGRLRDFYIILNCGRAQKLNYAAMQNGCAPIERWLLA